jgi:pyruvate/2-oxoglutarate dehydrogenase complex dihydrolipoamide dehydrogenase (E3) component
VIHGAARFLGHNRLGAGATEVRFRRALIATGPSRCFPSWKESARRICSRPIRSGTSKSSPGGS